MKAVKVIALTFLASAVAGIALAQNAAVVSGGPTRNDYRLHVIRPTEGDTITGTAIQVIVDTEIPTERGMAHDISSTPHPDVDVFVDGLFRGTMRDDRNVVNVENVQPGPHTIALLALNRSREVFDRKEINVSVIAPRVARAPLVAAVPVPAPVPEYVPPTAPPVVTAEDLPKTGTSDPLLAVAGVILLLGGLAIRRLA